VTGRGISGSDVWDMILEAVEARFGTSSAPEPTEWFSDNGLPYTARDTRCFTARLNLAPCFTPIGETASRRSNGVNLLRTGALTDTTGSLVSGDASILRGMASCATYSMVARQAQKSR
jgi:transposase InsO family protein